MSYSSQPAGNVANVGWRAETGESFRSRPRAARTGPGRCFKLMARLSPPSTPGAGERINKHTPGNYLRPVLEKLELARPGLGWYEATRDTFASQWVLSSGAIEKLKEILGHYSVIVTERYTHLRPDLFAQSDLGTIPLSLRPGDVFAVHIGQQLGGSFLCELV